MAQAGKTVSGRVRGRCEKKQNKTKKLPQTKAKLKRAKGEADPAENTVTPTVSGACKPNTAPVEELGNGDRDPTGKGELRP